ncbi:MULTISPECIES: hypothetical protein [unclassified Paenibacillus]|uniref:hypothetical protein n=1 Tax=unclassified Paenibacillus TaxID=185978 RepID=UPI002476A1CF|nr:MULTISPECIES: hypothetical protein [unclassified Paenibacillus]MDH6427284.1 chaperonin cofactor prefoldin [Paenibacillus sp. PastH-4]MDH6443314.1 chaperonin cofactor prefoldin [Paenibacillus sp. PastF-4]MDH6525982.1 chaperonin cofactor prefoldin [Paenibacillus sp. PastH-3]
MKKIISGVIAGALLLVGVSAFAAPGSLVGQKVQGLFSIEKGGEKIADAVIINGTAYATVRAVSEATGAALTIEGKKIIMSTEQGALSTPQAQLILLYNSQRDQIIREIANREAGINSIQSDVIPTHEQLAKELANNGALGQQQSQVVENLKKQIETMKSELIDLNKQLEEINAKIEALLK